MHWSFDGRGWLVFTHPSCDSELKIELGADLNARKVYSWLNNSGVLMEGFYEGDGAQAWFTKAWGKSVVLIRSLSTPPLRLNNVDAKDVPICQKYAMNSGHFSAPLHFICEKSVEDLKSRVNDENIEVTSAQFKPNLVFRGNAAYEEDNMRELLITDRDSNSIKLSIFKNWTRWKITTFNYNKGWFYELGEPFNTLRKYRSIKGKGVAFGMYTLIDEIGWINVGDTVTYTKKSNKPIIFD